jgi:adenylate cyclase
VERGGLDIFRPMGNVVLRGRASQIEIFEPVPDMASDERQKFAEIANRAIAGDTAALAELAAKSEADAGDKALGSFVYRLQHAEQGGFYVLD